MDAPAPAPQAPVITLDTTIGDLLKEAFFIADSIGEIAVDIITPTHLNVHAFATDGSLASIRLECRPGKWGGISGLAMTDEDRAAANEKFNAALEANTAPSPEPPPEGQVEAGGRRNPGPEPATYGVTQ